MSVTQAPLRFERVRNFGRVFNETRRFIRENFSVFFRTILFLAGPVVLLTCSLNIILQSDLTSGTEKFEFNRVGSYLALTMIYTQLRWTVNGLVIAIVVSHFVKVFREKGQGKFDVSDVTKSIFKDFFGNLLAFMVVIFGVALISTVLGYIIYGMINVSIGAALLMIFGGWLAYFMIRFPFWYFVFSIFIARTSDNNQNVFSAIGKAGSVFSGNWWSTWVVFFCMWLILYVVGFAISMPANIIAMVIKMTSIDLKENSEQMKLITNVLLSLGEFAKTIINSIFCVTVALHFYGLKEKLDGEGTKKYVELIGSKADDDEADYTW
jgi:hypothetical protein